MAGPSIFISYRHEDAADSAGRLRDNLETTFGKDSVFMDVDGIQAGADFRRVIEEEVARRNVLIVVIGDKWLTCLDANGKRRLDNRRDFVRLEVRAALQALKTLKGNRQVIPVLVQGASMPTAEQLPGPIRQLASLQGMSLRRESWDADIARLRGALTNLFPFEMGPPEDDGVRHDSREAARPRRLSWFHSHRWITVPVSVVAALVVAFAVGVLAPDVWSPQVPATAPTTPNVEMRPSQTTASPAAAPTAKPVVAATRSTAIGATPPTVRPAQSPTPRGGFSLSSPVAQGAPPTLDDQLMPMRIGNALDCPISVVEEMWPWLQNALRQSGIYDRPTILAALATIKVESAGTCRTLVEPIEIARVGQTGPERLEGDEGERVKYRGRGYLMLTLRHNYLAFGGARLVEDPELAAQPEGASIILARYFKIKKVPELAAQEDWREVRRVVAGAVVGLDGFLKTIDRLKTLPMS